MAFTVKKDGMLRRVITINLWLALPISLCSCGGPKPSGAATNSGLEALYAANAVHLALRDVARDHHDVLVRYRGALRFEDQGMQPANRPDSWVVGTMDEASHGRVTKLGLLLFEIRLVPATSACEGDAAFAYRGCFYAFKVSDVKGGKRADEVLPEIGISPLDFVKEAAAQVRDDATGKTLP